MIPTLHKNLPPSALPVATEDLVPALVQEWKRRRVDELARDIRNLAKIDHPRSLKRQQRYFDAAIARLSEKTAR